MVWHALSTFRLPDVHLAIAAVGKMDHLCLVRVLNECNTLILPSVSMGWETSRVVHCSTMHLQATARPLAGRYCLIGVGVESTSLGYRFHLSSNMCTYFM